MSDTGKQTDVTDQVTTKHEQVDYLTYARGIGSWLGTTDHKRVAILYLCTIFITLLVGGVLAVLMRVELWTPDESVMGATAFSQLSTLHGLFMVFAVLIPAIPAVLGNFILPVQLGAKGVAFPRLNLVGYYFFLLGTIFLFGAWQDPGIVTFGWNLNTVPSTAQYQAGQFLALAVFSFGLTIIITGINFLVTIHKMQAPGLTWFRLPMFVWGLYFAGLVQVFAAPVMCFAAVLLFLESFFDLGLFDPFSGGDNILFQQLFWFSTHPMAYAMALPAFGIILEVIATFSRRAISGYKAIVYSSALVVLLGFLAWQTHLIVSGQSVVSSVLSSFFTYLIAIPLSIIVLNSILTLHRGSIWLQTPMLYALGFLFVVLIGGLTGLVLDTAPLAVHLQGTQFEVGHLHYVAGAILFAFLGGLHYWWPKITGKMFNETAGRISLFLLFFGLNLSFFAQLVLGSQGMPGSHFPYLESFTFLNQLSSFGAFLMVTGILLVVFYLLASITTGRPAPANPWGASTLEWTFTGTRPIADNYERIPVVTRDPYVFSRDEAAQETVTPQRGKKPPHLKTYFLSLDQQYDASKLGMWLFVAIEMIFFGGLIVAFTIFRVRYPGVSGTVSEVLHPWFGGLAMLLLLTISLLMILVHGDVRNDSRNSLLRNLLFVVVLAAVLIGVTYLEYATQADFGLVPGAGFSPSGPYEALDIPNAPVFISILFAAKVLLGFHVIIGIGFTVILAVKANRGKYTPLWCTPVELNSLYWHVATFIWIILFPLLYLF